MPRISRRPSLEQTRPLIDFLRGYMKANTISLRKAAFRFGIDPSHLSRIISGEIAPDAGVCNQIADALGMPRVRIYALAGWLELETLDEQTELDELNSLFDPYLVQSITEIYPSIGDRRVRKAFLRLILKLRDYYQGSNQNRPD